MKVEMNWGETLIVSIPDTEDEFRIEYTGDQLSVRSKLQDDESRGPVIFMSTVEEDGNREDGEKSDIVIKTLTCTGCGSSFDLTEGELKFMQRTFKENYKDPVRCQRCRKLRMSRRRSSTNGERRNGR
jgi:hypothetical protein